MSKVDGMDNFEAYGDIFICGVNDDHLNIIHEARNKIMQVAPGHGLSTGGQFRKGDIVSVLGRDEGYTVKYNPLAEGISEGKARGNS